MKLFFEKGGGRFYNLHVVNEEKPAIFTAYFNSGPRPQVTLSLPFGPTLNTDVADPEVLKIVL